MRENETSTLRKNAKYLKSEMTKAERLLWLKIRKRQLNNVRFLRQKIVGNYIVDFLSFEAMLIIEIDGGQHAEQVIYDNARTEFLNRQGFHVIRFWNSEILLDIDGVLEQLRRIINICPHPNPPPFYGGGDL